MSREALDCKVFVTTQGLTALVDAMRVRGRLEDKLKDWLRDRRIAGYEVVAIGEPEDYEIYDLDDELITGVTGGTLPAVYVNVTYDRASADRPALGPEDELVREFRLVSLLSEPGPGSD
jgi:hypothetical protein